MHTRQTRINLSEQRPSEPKSEFFSMRQTLKRGHSAQVPAGASAQHQIIYTKLIRLAAAKFLGSACTVNYLRWWILHFFTLTNRQLMNSLVLSTSTGDQRIYIIIYFQNFVVTVQVDFSYNYFQRLRLRNGAVFYWAVLDTIGASMLLRQLSIGTSRIPLKNCLHIQKKEMKRDLIYLTARRRMLRGWVLRHKMIQGRNKRCYPLHHIRTALGPLQLTWNELKIYINIFETDFWIRRVWVNETATSQLI